MKLKIASTLYREARIDRAEPDSKKLRLSISSDEPYKRWDWEDGEYWEVLDHSPGAIGDERMKSGMPLLYNHDRDIVLGRSEGYECDGHKCFVEPVLSEADDVRSHITKVREGTLKDTSIGYEITGKGVEIGKKDGLPIYKFPFRIYEASVVSIPADISVGVGRMRDLEKKTEPKEIEIETKQLTPVRENEKTHSQEREASHKREGKPSMDTLTPEQIEQKAKEAKEAGQREERERVAEIQKHTKHFAESGLGGRKIDTSELAAKCIAEGKTVQEFKDAVMVGTFKDVKPIQTPDTQRLDGEDHDVRVIGDRPQAPSKRGLSIGEQFVRSDTFKTAITKRGQGERVASVETDISGIGIRGKVQMAQRAGWTSTDLAAINVSIQTGMVGLGMQRLTIMDLIAAGNTGQAAVIYPRENSFGTVDGTAVPAGEMPRGRTVGERGLKPLWEPDLTTESATAKKVAITTKVPDEFMADFPAARSYIDNRLPYMVDVETERQILYGDGLGNNLKGIFSTAGIQTRAIGADTVGDSLKKGLTDIEVNSFFEPDGYVFHPYDWETVRLLKDANGQYLAGGPFYIPYGNGVFMEMYTLWGKPVVKTTAVAYGRPVAGCFKLGAQYFMREGMRIEMTNANEDDFRRNLIMLRAEHRLALATYRPVAFLEFTGFPART